MIKKRFYLLYLHNDNNDDKKQNILKHEVFDTQRLVLTLVCWSSKYVRGRS